MVTGLSKITKKHDIYIILLAALIILTAILGYRVHILSEQLQEILEKNDGLAFAHQCSEESLDYLAIGNSITVHPLCDYWWNEIGMAASEPEKDYYHIVSAWLRENNASVNTTAVNFSMWETLATDRAEMLNYIEDYLCSELDLITIQLGENVSNLDTFSGDFRYLIQYIQEKSPNAKIIVVGDFWSHANRESIKQTVSEECGVIYFDLGEIVDDSDYMCGIGTTVFDMDGNPHVVEHKGVAVHPGDSGMQYIAEGIIKILKGDLSVS